VLGTASPPGWARETLPQPHSDAARSSRRSSVLQ
jgi:hypothetical protein